MLTSPPPFIIDLANVEKTYRGRIYALRGIDMRVRAGEIFGLLGPNGAGKSTLVKIMMTIVRPTRATGQLLGQPLGHKPTLRRVGYLPENHRFPRYLTGRQVLLLFSALADVDRATRTRRAAELLELVGMAQAADRKIGTYSKGMMQRIGLAQALMNDPDLVVLDEPTDGVDPIGRRDIRQILHGIRERGKTVFINSHLLSELELLCDRVAILLGGQVVRQGTLDELALGQRRYEIEIDATAEQLASLGRHFAQANWTIPGGHTLRVVGSTLHVNTDEASAVQPLIDQVRALGLTLRRIQPIRPSLEEMFISAVDPAGGPPS